MTATIQIDYQQLYSLVMQLSPQDRLRLSHDITKNCNVDGDLPVLHTIEAIDERIGSALNDIRNGNVESIECFFNEIDEKYPQLCR